MFPWLADETLWLTTSIYRAFDNALIMIILRGNHILYKPDAHLSYLWILNLEGGLKILLACPSYNHLHASLHQFHGIRGNFLCVMENNPWGGERRCTPPPHNPYWEWYQTIHLYAHSLSIFFSICSVLRVLGLKIWPFSKNLKTKKNPS